jgi:oligoribonuclease NrnB/cAMP/cGMP phosphodiesterase (DHH superfamily)
MTSSTIAKVMEQKREYRNEILKLAKNPLKKLGYHFNCPDGLVSAALMKHVFSSLDLTFIPIDYPMLKDEEVLSSFAEADWFAIVDLTPFNTEEIDYFFDHHISNKGKEINAKEHVFDPNAPSAATLIAKYFSDKIPEYLKELAEITEITDTASYKIPAPLELKKDYNNLSWDEKTWFLEDVCKTTYTIAEHGELIEIMTASGLQGLWREDILERVKGLRQSRKEAFEIADRTEIKNFIIIIDDPFHYNTAYIAREVMKRGAIGAAYITDYPGEVKVSLRLSRALKLEEVNMYRVDQLANQMAGGGHKGASGAEVEHLDIALENIKEWAKQKNLSTEILNLKKK